MAFRVLIVDDSRFQREMLRSIVGGIPGVVWDEAADGMTALRMMAAADFDLVLVDIEMPGMSGSDLARQIKRKRSSVTVGLVAGAANDDQVRRNLSGVADFFVAKPFSAAGIISEITRVMAPVAAEPDDMSPISVLVADDSRTIRDIMGDFVATTLTVPHLLFYAEDGQSAARIVKDARPDFVFLDINMPRGTGIDVLRFIRQRNPSAFVVMVTDVSEQNVVAKVRTLGVQGYLLKPPTHAKVAALIDRFLKR